ncbi:hypothetical protein SNE40_015227 [Patella caerulea]|uniref:Alpha-carbonic anhydrase domain-containing protein n=1 Tax=Patella caerulea TaxID=87958 RepID=A0AAN8JJE4_PATCE
MAFKAVIILDVFYLAQLSQGTYHDFSSPYFKKAMSLVKNYLPGHYNDHIPAAPPQGRRMFCRTGDESCFSYDPSSGIGPKCWFRIDYPLNKCCDERNSFQSPIDIPRNSSSRHIHDYLRYDSYELDGEIENNGIYPIFKPEEDHTVRLFGVPSSCGQGYILDNVHIHFGPRGDARQTEHTIGGMNYDAEAHIVHHREDFDSFADASEHPGGIVVISILFSTETGQTSPAFENIFHKLGEIIEFEEDENACSLENMYNICKKLFGIVEPPTCRSGLRARRQNEQKIEKCLLHNMESSCGDAVDDIEIYPNELLSCTPVYYNYEGSLTSPTCTEAVTWLVAAEPTRISRKTLKALTKLQSRFTGDLISDHGNLRPLQNICGREIEKINFRELK